jgi:hypothetical protein
MKPRHTNSKGASKRRKQGFETKPKSNSKSRSGKTANPVAVKVFEPDPSVAYSIEQTSHLAQVPRRRILIYCKERLILPLANPDVEGYWFDGETLRMLRQIEELRTLCHEPMASVRLILDLMREVQRLRNEMRALEV